MDLADLLRLKTADQLYNEMLTQLSGLGLRIANWRTGGPYRTLLRLDAVLLEKLYQLGVAFCQGGYLNTATGPWLDLLAAGFYGEVRQPSVFTEVTVRLTAAAGAGPYTLNPGAVIVSTPSGLKFTSTNPAAVTLPIGGTVELPFKAVSPGAKYNVATSAITRLDAPTLLGVTVDGPQASLVAGADTERDEKLQARCLAKWGTRSLDLPAAPGSPPLIAQSAVVESAYRYLALSASAEITKVGIHKNLKDGAFAANYVTIVLGSDGLAVSDAAVTAAQNLIDPRIPIGWSTSYKKSVGRQITLEGVVYCPVLALLEVTGKVGESLDDLARRLPLGGTVYRDALIGAIFYKDVLDGVPVPGKVIDVDLLQPTGDTILGYLEQASFVRLNLRIQGV